MAKKVKINITVDSKVWKAFSSNCRAVGLNASRVISVFMAGMIDDRPLQRMERFVEVTRELRRGIFERQNNNKTKFPKGETNGRQG